MTIPAKASLRSSFVSCATSFVRVVGMLAKWCPNFVDGLNASLMARNVGYTGFPSDVITSRSMRAHSLVCALSFVSSTTSFAETTVCSRSSLLPVAPALSGIA